MIWDVGSGFWDLCCCGCCHYTAHDRLATDISLRYAIRQNIHIYKKIASRRVEKVAGDLWLVEVGMPLNGDLFVFGLCLCCLKSVLWKGKLDDVCVCRYFSTSTTDQKYLKYIWVFLQNRNPIPW